MDEREALRALKGGSEEALSWFIERYAAYAAAIINSIVLPALTPHDAEEALSDVFVTLWRSAGRVEPGHERGYIAAIARSRALDALRAHKAALPLNEDVLVLDAPGLDEILTERELDVRCDGLDLASAAEEDGIHAEIPGLEGAYVEFVRLTGGALKVGISRDMAAGEEYSFRPYLLSADGSRYEAASGVRGITPLDRLGRPRGWDEGETSATLVYTIPAPGAEELGGCTLCLRVDCRDALRGTWEIPVELSEGEEPIELRADIRDGDKLYEDVHISLTPLCLRIECLDEAFIGYGPSDIPALTASLEGADGPIQTSEPGMDWTAPIQPADYNNPDGSFTAIWYARSAIDTASVTAIVIGDTRIEI